MNNNDFFNNNFFKNDPSELFKDLGKQVYNQFSSRAFPTNIYDKNDAYVLEAELPSLSKEDISLKFEQHILTIKAYKKSIMKIINHNLLMMIKLVGALQLVLTLKCLIL